MRAVGWGMVAALLAAAGAGAAEASVTPDGEAIAYSTNASHLPADDDANFDVYLWNRGVLTLASPGPDPTGHGVLAGAISDDGSTVVLRSANPLLPEDTDTAQDVYLSSGGALTLVSTGPGDGTAAPAAYAGSAGDLSRVLFVTAGRLTADDADDALDIYEWEAAGGTTRLVSTTPAGVAPGYHSVGGVSDDGSRILEVTDEALVPQDTDSAPDVYERSDSTVTLVSQGPSADTTPSPIGAAVVHTTPSLRSVIFSSWDRLAPGDRNDDVDLYQRRDGRTLLVTARADGVSPACPQDPLGPGRGVPCEPHVFGQSKDGATILFSSPKPLTKAPLALGVVTPGGTGGLFVRTATSITLLDSQPWSTAAISPDGQRFVVETHNQRTAADTDAEPDVYAVEGTAWRLLTPGTTLASDHITVSADARVVYFDTTDALTPADADGDWDTYVSTPTAPVLASTGPADDLATPALTANLGISDDGSRMFFSSMKPMVAADTDAERDLYLRAGGVTQLLS